MRKLLLLDVAEGSTPTAPCLLLMREKIPMVTAYKPTAVFEMWTSSFLQRRDRPSAAQSMP